MKPGAWDALDLLDWKRQVFGLYECAGEPAPADQEAQET
jgi:hypothetical protein